MKASGPFSWTEVPDRIKKGKTKGAETFISTAQLQTYPMLMPLYLSLHRTVFTTSLTAFEGREEEKKLNLAKPEVTKNYKHT